MEAGKRKTGVSQFYITVMEYLVIVFENVLLVEGETLFTMPALNCAADEACVCV